MMTITILEPVRKYSVKVSVEGFGEVMGDDVVECVKSMQSLLKACQIDAPMVVETGEFEYSVC